MSNQETPSLHGDRVRFEDDERLDIPDTVKTLTLALESLMRAIGGIVGTGSGALTRPTFDKSNLNAVEIGPCLLYFGEKQGNNNLITHGRVMIYDPNRTGQNNTVDLNSYSDPETPVIWARRTEDKQNSQNRKKWSTGSQSEFSSSFPVEWGERIQWAVTDGPNTKPTKSLAWFKVARVTSWSSGKPNIDLYSPFDPLQDDPSTSVQTSNPWVAVGSSTDYGSLGRLLKQITQVLGARLDTGLGLDWTTMPNRGLKQLHEDLNTAESDINTIQSRLNRRHVLAWAFVATDDNGNYSIQNAEGFKSVKKNNDPGDVSVVLTSSIRFNTSNLAISVTPIWDEANNTKGEKAVHITPLNSAVQNSEVRMIIYDSGGDKRDYSFSVVVYGEYT